MKVVSFELKNIHSMFVVFVVPKKSLLGSVIILSKFKILFEFHNLLQKGLIQ